MNIRIRLSACLVILSVMISIIFFSNAVSDVTHTPEYTIHNKGIAANTGIYYMENWNRLGRLYLINDMGDVLYMTDSRSVKADMIHSINIANDRIYAVYSMEAPLINDTSEVYRVGLYSPYLELVGQTDPFIIDADEMVRSIDIAQDAFYITTIGDRGNTANVYEFPISDIAEIESGSIRSERLSDNLKMPEYLSGLKRPESVIYRTAEGGNYFGDACYDGSNIEILTDTDSPTGAFSPDVRVASAVHNMHFTPGQQLILYSNYVMWWAGGLIIWFILVVLLIIILRRRNRNIYVFIITEIVFLIFLTAAIFFVKDQYMRSESRQNVRYGVLVSHWLDDYLPDLSRIDLSDPDFYNSNDYEYIRDELRDFLSSGYNDHVFYDIFLMRTRSGVIVADVRGNSRRGASYVYGSAMTEIQDYIKHHSALAYRDVNVNGESLTAVAIPDEDPSIDAAIVVVCYKTGESTLFWNEARSVFILYLISVIVGTLLIAVIFYLQALDLSSLEHAMSDVALGRMKIRVPDTPALDVRGMWNSLSEIVKRMEEINYEKYRIFEAYYRFAPKNIETVMGRESIFEVKNGDITGVEGTLLLLCAEKGDSVEKRVKDFTSIMSYMSRFTETREGILVSQDVALTMLRFFFLKDFEQTVSGATQFLHRNSSNEDTGFISGFLYNENFIYGIAGVESQSLSFITSDHSESLEEYAEWFGELRLPLVMTEKVMKREEAGQVRYIGFIMLGEEKRRVDLYEGLDAESARVRQLKLAARDKFEETLNLVYAKEYYHARNRFSEIIKECPEDRLARWYLFECEAYLNGEVDASYEGALHIKDIDKGIG